MIAGIITAYYWEINKWLFVFMVALGFLALLLQLFIRNTAWLYKNRFWLAIPVYTLSFSLGYLSLQTKHLKGAELVCDQEQIIEGKVLSSPETYSKGYKFYLRPKHTETGVLIYLQTDKTNIEKGDEVLLRLHLLQPETSLVKEDYDQAYYLYVHNAQYVAYIKANDVLDLSKQGRSYIQNKLNALRAYTLNSLDELIEDDDVKAVLQALVLGDKSNLSDELEQSYMKVGIIHVLAVSGLHVGIIYGLLMLIFMPLSKNRSLFIIANLLGIILIWLFAALTGFSASVSRASLMFSIMLLAPILGRENFTYNSIAASAFILLLINPKFLFQPGFQLSYIAVVGIVALNPIIYPLLTVKNKWLDKLWALCAVTISAQLATTPISLYYFHQFPLLFLLSNIPVLLLIAPVMYISLAMLIANIFSGVLAKSLAAIVGFFVNTMNNYIQWIAEISFASLKNVFVSVEYLLLIYSALVLFVVYYQTRSRKLGIAFVVLLSLSFLVYPVKSFIRGKEHSVSVLNDAHSSLIQIKNKSKVTYLLSTKSNPKGYYQTRLERLAQSQQAQIDTIIILSGDENIEFTYHSKKFLLYQKEKANFNSHTQYDFVLIANGAAMALAHVGNMFNTNQLIADRSNSIYYLKQLKNTNYPIYFTFEEGTYSLNFDE